MICSIVSAPLLLFKVLQIRIKFIEICLKDCYNGKQLGNIYKKKLKQMVICVRVMGKCWSCVKINI